MRRAGVRRNGFHSCPCNVTLSKFHLHSASFFLPSYSFFLWDFFFFVYFFCEKYHPYCMHLKRNPCPVRMLEAIVRKIRVFKPHKANCLLTPLSSVIVQFVLLTQQGELEILKFPSIFFPIHFQRWKQKLFFFFFLFFSLYKWKKMLISYLVLFSYTTEDWNMQPLHWF